LCRVYLRDLYESHQGITTPEKSTTIDNFLHEQVAGTEFALVEANLDRINQFLALRSFMVGYHVSLADIHMWSQLRSIPSFMKQIKTGQIARVHLHRWFQTIENQPMVQKALLHIQEQTQLINKSKKDQGSFEIDLIGASEGNVVTRFPPEPSGYLHIGHAKAACLNEYFARRYKGKFIVRFDDTNPSKEKSEFEQSIMEDLSMLGLTADVITHSSDHFNKLQELIEKLIKQGDAYVDDTDQETMRHERMHGIASCNRNKTVEENLKDWKEMIRATDRGLMCCVRAKMSVDDKNKALRDPVFYRCNLTPHHRTGSKFKVYPTYDFACPVIDSLEGVTHALRTNEYRDRNPQYEWVIKKLNLRHVHIWDFSRMNFVYTLLSKRKLQWFVDEGHVTGWDDPRFPTVRGILRRGMTVEALKQYIIMQGASSNNLMLEWDKIWAINKKVIDPIAPRHVALDKATTVPLVIIDGPKSMELKSLLKHKKNPDIGLKQTAYHKNLLLNLTDVVDVVDGEELTLMDWGNVILTQIQRDARGAIQGLEAKLNLSGDVKSTKKKLTWLVDASKVKEPTKATCSVLIKDYDYLITKKKLDDGDDFQSVLTPKTEFLTPAVGDANLRNLSQGDIIQLERRGYFICDGVDKNQVVLLSIPDSKAASLASKHQANASTATKAAVASPKAKKAISAPVADVKPTEDRSKSPQRKASEAKSRSPSPKKTPSKSAKSESKKGGHSMYPLKPVYDHECVSHICSHNMYSLKNVYDV
jgi:glutamyl-tRNA synthetase